MLCRKCNYILTGKENFCPNCGTMPLNAAQPLPTIRKTEPSTPEVSPTQENERTADDEKMPGESVFGKNKDAPRAQPSGVRIFNIDSDEEYRNDSIRQEDKDEKKKGSIGKIFLLLFICCTLAVTAFGLADYFGITPQLSRIVNTFSQKNTTVQESTTLNFSHDKTIVEPEINYPMETAYIFSGTGLTLRKGPANSFAPLYSLTDLTQVKIFGGSLVNPNWVYVYCPEKESYGWLDGSFLCSDVVGENELTEEYSSYEEIPTAYYREDAV